MITWDIGLTEAFRLRYSYKRLQWLLTTISAMSLLTFSAQELWAGSGVGLCYHIDFPAFCVYVTLFIVAILYVNVKDFQKICERRIIVMSCAFISMIIDLALLSFSEFFTLVTINQLSPDLLRSFLSIFLIVLPLSLGELTLSSLTTEYLRKRTEKLRAELTDLKKGVSELQKKRGELKKRIQELERKRTKFKRVFDEEKRSSGEGNE